MGYIPSEVYDDLNNAKTDFKQAAYGEDVRDGLVAVDEAVAEALGAVDDTLEEAISHQLIQVDKTLSNDGDGADALVVGERMYELYSGNANNTTINLFNGNLHDGRITDTGEIDQPSAGWYYTDYIAVNPGDKYVATYNVFFLVAFYGKGFQFKGRYNFKDDVNAIVQIPMAIEGVMTDVIPDDVYYMRLTGMKEAFESHDSLFMINKGNRLLPYIPYGATDFNNVVAYVDSVNGKDDWGGSPGGANQTRPYKSINAAIDAGATVIYARAGVYNEILDVKNKAKFALMLDTQPKNYGSDTADGTILDKVILRYCDELSESTYQVTPDYTLYWAEYPDGEQLTSGRIYDCYVAKTKSPDPTTGIYEYPIGAQSGGAYWCAVYERGETHKYRDSQTLVPVVYYDNDNDPFQKLKTTEGSFLYHDGYIYIHPFGNTNEDKTFLVPKSIYYPNVSTDADRGTPKANARFTNIADLTIAGVSFECNLSRYAIRLDGVGNANIINCDAALCCGGAGFSAHNSNVTFETCLATQNASDGFGINGGGRVNLYNCSGINNRDDGCSHHYATSGEIRGGIWTNNKKGGLSPTYGADVNVYNAVCTENKYGVYYAGSNPNENNNVVSGCFMEDNTTADLYVDYYSVLEYNNVCQTKINGQNGEIISG